jgi:hypothetical protein
MVVIAGIDGEGLVGGLGCDQKALGLAGLPRVFQMAVTAGSFIPEISGVNTVALA